MTDSTSKSAGLAASPVSYGTHFFHSSAAGSSHAPRGPPTTSPRMLKCSWTVSVAGCHLATAHPNDFFCHCYLLPLPRSPAPCRQELLHRSHVHCSASPPRRRRGCMPGTFICRLPRIGIYSVPWVFHDGLKSQSEIICKRGIVLKRINWLRK